ncbi:hypothetical protein GCM10011575_25810 [Microlunatus endophyticus]|uniref:Uncharacterized protein n=1 Tax=Microlunatus endophyticus TaxID=1716077 RepID=A0A917W615_9ACTN|nr:hypothetical protein [Microlunatus endophyticus]GGL66161.1 hypothetical protein GCM10011575_25810 [Microlunatus endophyticus]
MPYLRPIGPWARGVDRGNYPVLGFTDSDGDTQDYFPCVVADTGVELAYGFAAAVDASGIISARISDLETGYSREHGLTSRLPAHETPAAG